MAAEEIERLKLEDGIRLHESVKVELETYARETGNPIVKPFLLVIARDTTHAGQLVQLIQSDGFFEGRYQTKVIQVDSSKTGAEEDEMIQRLLAVESTEEPTEIVIHVNKLKEGWDVTNLYTIVPLRASKSTILTEQTIGRGMRLPYGKRVGVAAVDRLTIVAHDKFQAIIDEANNPNSVIRTGVIIGRDVAVERKETVVVEPEILTRISQPNRRAGQPVISFPTTAEQEMARTTIEIVKRYERLACSADLKSPEIQAEIAREVRA